MNFRHDDHAPSRRPPLPPSAYFRDRPRGERNRGPSSTLGMALTFGLSLVASPEGLRVRTTPPSHPRKIPSL